MWLIYYRCTRVFHMADKGRESRLSKTIETVQGKGIKKGEDRDLMQSEGT
ncbi:hypothetical protein LEMLEM_LOCUS19867 [Lemmus lemmus]